MNIYKVSQTENRGYDTYDSFICYALTEEDAANQLPTGRHTWKDSYYAWCTNPSKTTVEYIGTSTYPVMAGLILSSFNAG